MSDRNEGLIKRVLVAYDMVFEGYGCLFSYSKCDSRIDVYVGSELTYTVNNSDFEVGTEEKEVLEIITDLDFRYAFAYGVVWRFYMANNESGTTRWEDLLNRFYTFHEGYEYDIEGTAFCCTSKEEETTFNLQIYTSISEQGRDAKERGKAGLFVDYDINGKHEERLRTIVDYAFYEKGVMSCKEFKNGVYLCMMVGSNSVENRKEAWYKILNRDKHGNYSIPETIEKSKSKSYCKEIQHEVGYMTRIK